MPILTSKNAEPAVDLAEWPTGYPLKSSVSITVEPLTFGVVRHGLFIEEETVCLLSREPGVLTTRSLLVDGGLLIQGEVLTAVFNFGNKPARIRKGDIISRIISLEANNATKSNEPAKPAKAASEETNDAGHHAE